MNIRVCIRKVVLYCFGLFVMALGVAISKLSNLGVSPVNSIPCVVSNILEIDMGICTTSVFVCFIVIQILIMRKEFKIVNLLQILCSFLFGFFVSAANAICGYLLPGNIPYYISVVYLMVSILFVAVGILFYLNADIISLPGEGVMQAISYKTGIKVSTAKIMFDWTMVIGATVLSLVFLGELNGVREGTVIAAVGVGVVLRWLEQILAEPVNGFIQAASQTN